MHRRIAIALLIVPGTLLWAHQAQALGATLNPGVLASGVIGPEPALALGGEASFMVFPGDGVIQEQLGIGGFLQAQSYDLKYGRYAFGAQIGSFFGAELGYAYREEGPETSWSHGVHAALFGSLGFGVLALRSTFPVSSGEDATHAAPGFEFALCVALKIPILIGDVQVMGHMW